MTMMMKKNNFVVVFWIEFFFLIQDLGKYGILYYNALFISIPLFVLSLCIDDYGECFLEFEHWNSPWFVLAFLMSNIMGFVLMYSTALCTQYNSALTTTIVGCLKVCKLKIKKKNLIW